MFAIPIATNTQGVRGPRQGTWTYADWETLPPDDEHRYEIIDGVLYMSTAPSLYHQWIVKQVYRLVGLPAEDAGLGYSFMAPVGVMMPHCQPVQPDFVYVQKANAGILRDGKIRGVPDLIVEVLSPGNRDYDEDVKLRAYAACGVPEYGCLEPAGAALSTGRRSLPCAGGVCRSRYAALRLSAGAALRGWAALRGRTGYLPVSDE
jgi:Uma2 family endonuclease